jgi:hypothetical protein
VKTPNPHEEGINIRMGRLLARPFCPKCYLFIEEHDDNACNMRYEEDEPCATSAPSQPSLESLCLLVGDSGYTV